jgi:hypothetical protein
LHTTQLKAEFESLSSSDDLVSIKSALYAICSEFGVVRRLDVLLARQGAKRQALCFLRMEDAEHEQQIMRCLEIARFAGDLIVVVDLPVDSPVLRTVTKQSAGVMPLS